jgi:hypothetical protein
MLGMDADAPVANRLHGGRGKVLHLHEPLLGQIILDGNLAPLRIAHLGGVRFLLGE